MKTLVIVLFLLQAGLYYSQSLNSTTWMSPVGAFAYESGTCCIPSSVVFSNISNSSLQIFYTFPSDSSIQGSYCNYTGNIVTNASYDAELKDYNWTDATLGFNFLFNESSTITIYSVMNVLYTANGSSQKDCEFELYPPNSGYATNGYQNQLIGEWQPVETNQYCCYPETFQFSIDPEYPEILFLNTTISNVSLSSNKFCQVDNLNSFETGISLTCEAGGSWQTGSWRWLELQNGEIIYPFIFYYNESSQQVTVYYMDDGINPDCTFSLQPLQSLNSARYTSSLLILIFIFLKVMF